MLQIFESSLVARLARARGMLQNLVPPRKVEEHKCRQLRMKNAERPPSDMLFGQGNLLLKPVHFKQTLILLIAALFLFLAGSTVILSRTSNCERSSDRVKWS